MGGSRSYLLVALNDRQNTINNWQSGRGNDWIDQMLHGAMLMCEAHGYRMLFELVEAGSPDLDRRVVAILSALQPDGIILTPPHSQNVALVEMLTRRKVPVVRMGVPGDGVGFGVFMDDRAAAAEATRHLIDLGHRRIGFIAGSPRFEASRQRQDGHRDAMTRAGLSIDDALIAPGDFTFESGVVAAEALLTRPDRPTAILASNDEMALAALHVASRLGIRVPELSLVSFDDTPGVRLSVPGLTSVRQPISDMAAKAAELLIGVSKTGVATPSDHLLPFGLEVRGSTAPRT